MAKGYPDYFGFSFFPSYGNLNRLQSLGTTVQPDETFIIHDLYSKGQLFGGQVIGSSPSSSPVSTLYIYVDDILASQIYIPFDNYPLYSIDRDDFGKLVYLDLVQRRYIYQLPLNVPFDTHVKITIQNNDTSDLWVTSDLSYYIVKT